MKLRLSLTQSEHSSSVLLGNFFFFPFLVLFSKTLNFSAWNPVLPVAMRFSLSVCLEWFENGQILGDRGSVEEETAVFGSHKRYWLVSSAWM